MINAAALLEISHESLYEHVFAAHTEHRPCAHQHLGYVDKSADKINVCLPRAGVDLSVQQLLLSLSSGTQLSSTGFICWQTALYFADWAVAFAPCPLAAVLHKDSVVLELGAGVSAVLAAVVGPRVGHYVASDQAHLLKLMKQNFRANVVSQRYDSNTCAKDRDHAPRRLDAAAKWSQIDFVALDWEGPGPGTRRFAELTGRPHADVVVACDTIYNSYLIAPFLACMALAMCEHTVAVVAMQLRDEAITEEFLERALQAGLRVFQVRDEHLTPELIEGFAVYCFRKRKAEGQAEGTCGEHIRGGHIWGDVV
ncbi:hypothetical protein METBIDRAFT_39159 [Metschnikowia bicuspidata var. bicuspidata NRRL YB-4993]|uniref:Ribosomal lysine N-methyltransferase 5 n=1 Tax=Metschnikowia bicuspidata var. bicuspidata NRRL YB-4993 TaxID=869754 RepID=A0A1A0HEH0_9ASCO|nr:hypothetical protein METBIDRAFT_39159 [Metschnikowia bicuspidata var. bicuspidata NRRL YB-4993]OBA22509.1 hypothetical protein METBIDRAFT_39159 [Metschnikowia bicuspidata var. bicuspidata NRRL YB-4993]